MQQEDDYDEDGDADFVPGQVSESESEDEQQITQAAPAPKASDINVDEIFNDLKARSTSGHPTDWTELLGRVEEAPPSPKRGIFVEKTPEPVDEENPKVWINVSYQFAGRLVTESKLVDASSAEARAYANSTGLQVAKERKFRTAVPVIRTIPGTEEPVELQIKLKRPSLIDKFLAQVGSKKMKLSTLEKSRLDWASFVDTSNIKDDLSLHNKAGYLEKQDFLHRLEAKRDSNYEKARDAQRARK